MERIDLDVLIDREANPAKRSNSVAWASFMVVPPPPPIAAIRGHVAPGAGFLSASEICHRDPHSACDHARRFCHCLYRTHAHEIRSEAEAESRIRSGTAV